MNRSVMTLAAAALLLQGCASMNQDECLVSDWRLVGYEDGAAGQPANRIGEHRKACASYGVTPDLTAYRALMFLLYFPFLLVGFIFLSTFIHGILRRPQKDSWWKTLLNWSLINTLTLIVPLILFMLIQYIPLYLTGAIPFVGPGGFLANYTMSLFHIIGVLILVIPLSTWFYQLTGKIYLGAILNAALVAWMFTSSQVIAAIPI